MVDTRSASPAFEVKDKCGTGDELHATASERANDILWTMGRRIEVLRTHLSVNMTPIIILMTHGFKIAFRLKIPLTKRAIVVKARLTIVLLQTILIGKDPIARVTIPVGLFVVVLQLTEVVEMLVAILTIGVVRTLNPMLFQPCPGWKVFRAIIADIVTR